MNANLTFNSIVFNKTFDENGLGNRQSTTRGLNTPDVLTVRSQDYVDSATKLPGSRFTARIDASEIVGSNTVVTSAYFVIAVPGVATQARIDSVVATLKAAVADATFIPAILNNEK